MCDYRVCSRTTLGCYKIDYIYMKCIAFLKSERLYILMHVCNQRVRVKHYRSTGVISIYS